MDITSFYDRHIHDHSVTILPSQCLSDNDTVTETVRCCLRANKDINGANDATADQAVPRCKQGPAPTAEAYVGVLGPCDNAEAGRSVSDGT
jgi:hypothetical protein